MGISSSGIGSGLDVNSIVTQLMNAERAPLTALEKKESSYNTKLSAYGTIKGSIAKFQDALQALSTASLNTKTATSSNADMLGVSVIDASKASLGSYSIQVSALAKEHRITLPAVASAATSIGTGSIKLQIGNDPQNSITLPSKEYTLQGLSDAINAAHAGATATVISGDAGNQLVVTSNKTGTSNQITISAGTDANAALTNFVSSAKVLQNAQDAKMNINGIDVTRASNQISDAIPGITLQLNKVDSANSANVNIATDKSKITSAISGFVSEYNALSTKIKGLTSYDAATKKAGALNGDQGANSVLTALRSEFGKAASGSGFRLLSDIGITFQRDGTLAINDTKLQSAIDTKPDDVVSLFGTADGFATRLTKITKSMVADTGFITTYTDSLKSAISRIDMQKDNVQVRLNATQKRLTAQFNALDSKLSSMQSTNAYLTQQLALIAKNDG